MFQNELDNNTHFYTSETARFWQQFCRTNKSAMAASTTVRCYGDKIREKHRYSKTSELQEQPTPDDETRTTSQERCDRVKSAAPSGFHELLQKVIRAVKPWFHVKIKLF